MKTTLQLTIARETRGLLHQEAARDFTSETQMATVSVNRNQPCPAVAKGLTLTSGTGLRAAFAYTLPMFLLVLAPVISLQADENVSDEFRQTVSLNFPIEGDLTGFSQLEYRNNPDQSYQAYQLVWPGLTYSATRWLQFSGGFLTRYTDNQPGADQLELRPFAGIKLFAPNGWKWNLYNYTRYEYRDTEDLETHHWTDYNRLRSQFGAEFPLTSRERAWQPKTWYGLANVEPFYRFDRDQLNPVCVRGGFGYVMNDRLRLEFIYAANFSRSNGDPLDYTENIFQVNLRIGLKEGLLLRLLDPTE